MGLLKNQKQIKLLFILILISFVFISNYEISKEPQKIEIENISNYLNKVVLIEGRIFKDGKSEKNLFLEIKSNTKNKINGIIFEKIEIEQFLEKEVKIIGKVNYYDKKYSLIIYEIKSQNQFEII